MDPTHTQVEHLRNGFLQPNARLLPAAGVMKGMLVEMRTGEVHGVDLTMVDAYRWSKEVQPIHLEKHKYVQMSEVFDVCAHGARHAANSTRRMVHGTWPCVCPQNASRRRIPPTQIFVFDFADAKVEQQIEEMEVRFLPFDDWLHTLAAPALVKV